MSLPMHSWVILRLRLWTRTFVIFCPGWFMATKCMYFGICEMNHTLKDFDQIKNKAQITTALKCIFAQSSQSLVPLKIVLLWRSYFSYPFILVDKTAYAWWWHLRIMINITYALCNNPKSFETTRRLGSQTKVIIFIFGLMILMALAMSSTWFSGPTTYSEFLSIRISSGATSGKEFM